MTPSFLVALREYRQLTSTRSFWLTLLIIPGVILLATVLPNLYRHQDGGSAFVVLDPGKCCLAEIDNRVELAHQEDVINRLRDYARQWHVKATNPRPIWADAAGRSLDDQDAEEFVAAGGLDAALAQLRPLLPPGATPFVPPPRRFVRVDPPPGIDRALSADAFGEAITPFLAEDFATADGPRPLTLAAYIPFDIENRTSTLRYFTNGNGEVSGIISGVVLHNARIRRMVRDGLSQDRAKTIEWYYPVQRVTAPTPGTGAERVVVRSILPLCVAYLLLLSVIVSGTMMLQSVIEERSNKLIETILACVTADQLMRGKLLGVGAVGLTIVGTWVVFAVIAARMLPPQLAALLAPALETLDSPLAIVSMLFYFLTGYLLTSMLFLSIGAISDSMQDAQGYMMPLVLVLTGPFIAIGGSVVTDPDGFLPKLFSWVPIYTPFAMLSRLGGGVAVWEIVGTSALLLLFLTAEFVLLGRVFRASLLRAGEPPRITQLLKLMFRPALD